jgi:3-oxoacyl-[acyl-carrier protein] reductase
LPSSLAHREVCSRLNIRNTKEILTGFLGFGAALAEHFALRGANVVITYATSASDACATSLAKKFESEYNVKSLAVRADLGEIGSPQLIVDTAKAHFARADGSFQIDIIVNNAAIVNAQPIHELDLDLWDATFNLNCRAPALLIKAAYPYLPHDRSGRIVNISSATTTWGLIQQTSYAGTKGAIEAMTRVWARELAERCTVNAVSPGPMDTGLLNSLPDAPKEALKPLNALIPLAAAREGIDSPEIVELAASIGGRPGYLDEVAGIVGVVCLPESGWMTGNQIGASGGGAFVR